MDAEALRRTLATGRTWFYSRSRQEYWQKGETSGDRQYVREVRLDCDGDALVVLVDQHGRGACHTGERTLLLPDHRDGPGGARAVTPGGGPGPAPRGRWASAPTRPSSPRWPRSTPSSRCGARWSPTPSRPSPASPTSSGTGTASSSSRSRAASAGAATRSSGRRPLATLTARGRRVEATGRLGPGATPTTGILAAVEALVTRFQSPVLAGLPPLHGGLVGYLGYDVVREVERLPDPPADDLGHPDAALVVIGQFCAFDHWRQRIVLVDNVVVPDAPDGVVDTEAVAEAYDGACARLRELAADCARPAGSGAAGDWWRRRRRGSRRPRRRGR